jgi:hypothetical protein
LIQCIISKFRKWQTCNYEWYRLYRWYENCRCPGVAILDMQMSKVPIISGYVLWQQILNSLEWTISVSRSQRQESFFNVSTCLQTVQHCCHTAFEYCRSWDYSLKLPQKLRLFSQVALIKTSNRANIKTETLSKIFSIKYNCDLYTVKIIHVWDKCVHAFFKHKNRRLVNIVWLLF